jgi:hypothetical protein
MKGVDPDMFDSASPDNPVIIQRIITMAKEMGLELASSDESVGHF